MYNQDSVQSGTPDCPVMHQTVSGGAPDSVRCARLNTGEQATLGKVWRRTTIIHRTVRWCTGLSGEPTVDCANGRQRNQRATRVMSQRSVGAPDCPVCTGLSGEPRRSLLQRSAVPVLEGDRSPDKLQYLSGGAPDCPVRHLTESKYCLPNEVQRLLGLLGL
jgi:hypothetical protein